MLTFPHLSLISILRSQALELTSAPSARLELAYQCAVVKGDKPIKLLPLSSCWGDSRVVPLISLVTDRG